MQAAIYIKSERHGSCNNHPQIEAIKARFGSAGVGKFELPPDQAVFFAEERIEVDLDAASTLDYADARADLMFLRCFAGAQDYSYWCICHYCIVDNREMLRVQMTRWAVPPAAPLVA
jgi:hypothetical protein